MMNSPYRAFTPAAFGQAQQQQQQPQLNLQPQLMPWPEQGGAPGVGQALMGGVSQLYQAMQQRRGAPGMGAGGGRFGGQMQSLFSSLGG